MIEKWLMSFVFESAETNDRRYYRQAVVVSSTDMFGGNNLKVYVSSGMRGEKPAYVDERIFKTLTEAETNARNYTQRGGMKL